MNRQRICVSAASASAPIVSSSSASTSMCLCSSSRSFSFGVGRIADIASSHLDKVSKAATALFAKEEFLTEPKRPFERRASMPETLAERIALQKKERQRLVPKLLKVSKCRRYLIVDWETLPGGNPTRTTQDTQQQQPVDGWNVPEDAVVTSSSSSSGRPLSCSPQQRTRLLAELLRAESTSTDVKGSNALIYGKRGLTITEVVPQGNYAVRLQFSDDHSGGIFPYDYLHYLGENKWRVMRKYLSLLKEKRKSRLPPAARRTTAVPFHLQRPAKKTTSSGNSPNEGETSKQKGGGGCGGGVKRAPDVT